MVIAGFAAAIFADHPILSSIKYASHEKTPEIAMSISTNRDVPVTRVESGIEGSD